MKKLLFIVPYPPAEAPSQRFRFEQYFQYLDSQGHNFVVSPFWNKKAWTILYSEGKQLQKIVQLLSAFFKRAILLLKVPSFDFVFIHREATPIGPPWMEFIISRMYRKRIIYDFDDAIWLINTSEQNKIATHLKWHSKVKSICKWSCKVSCGNAFLAEYARQFCEDVIINPTTIDTEYHVSKFSESKDQKIVIGWTGTHSTTKYLDALISVFEKLQRKYDIDVQIISDQPPRWNFKNYSFVKWNSKHEIEQLDKIDIGIMPLENTEWEKGKCGFKALQYMALSKPVVASNVGVNVAIVEQGKNGFLAEHTNDWITYLTILIENPALRISMGKEGRKTVEAHYSVRSNFNRFLALFE